MARSSTKENEELDKNRDKMRELTKSILDLVKARQDLSIKIASAKKNRGLPTEDKEVETRLLDGSNKYAKSIGLDENLATEIVSKLIESSKVTQLKETHFKSVKSFLKTNRIRTVSIIGAGRMGGWFAKYFKMLGAKIILYDEKSRRAQEMSKNTGWNYTQDFESTMKSDLVVLAIPITNTPDVIRKLANRVASKGRLRVIEVSSVKSLLAKQGLLDLAKTPSNVEIYSVHPLFGPNANHFASNSMAVVHERNLGFIEELFPHFTIFKMNWKQHDELMGVMLSLPHALALVFASEVTKRSRQIPKGISTPSYEHMVDLARKVLSENPRVYFEIQSTNPNTQKILNSASRSIKKIEKLIERESDFLGFFKDVKRGID